MKFHLYPVLFVALMIPLSVLSETDDAKKDNNPKTKRSIWQRILPRTGDIEGTVYQHDTDLPLIGAEVRIVETDQSEKTGEDGTFRFTEILSENTHSPSPPRHVSSKSLSENTQFPSPARLIVDLQKFRLRLVPVRCFVDDFTPVRRCHLSIPPIVETLTGRSTTK